MTTEPLTPALELAAAGLLISAPLAHVQWAPVSGTMWLTAVDILYQMVRYFPMRPKLFDPDAVIASALPLFWRQGYEGTHMPELLDAMGLGKASFYNAFTSKHAVFLAVLDCYFGAVDHILARALEGEKHRDQAAACLLDAILAVARDQEGKTVGWRGCLIGNTALEMGAQDETVRHRLNQGVHLLRRHFANALSLADRDGRVLPDSVVSALALHAVAGIQGILVLAKAGMFEEEIRAAKLTLLSTLRASQPI
jgi:TetR/AcrR family transcriptional repressor of nem operon